MPCLASNVCRYKPPLFLYSLGEVCGAARGWMMEISVRLEPCLPFLCTPGAIRIQRRLSSPASVRRKSLAACKSGSEESMKAALSLSRATASPRNMGYCVNIQRAGLSHPQQHWAPCNPALYWKYCKLRNTNLCNAWAYNAKGLILSSRLLFQEAFLVEENVHYEQTALPLMRLGIVWGWIREVGKPIQNVRSLHTVRVYKVWNLIQRI
jgi:hypothetical protein